MASFRVAFFLTYTALCLGSSAPQLRNNVSRRLQANGVTAGTQLLTGTMSETGCYAPKAEGGWGFCGPLSCNAAYVTCSAEGGGPQTVDGVTGTFLSGTSESNCNSFLARTDDADTTDWNPRGTCDSSCTQQTNGVCSGEFLAKVLVGSGVKHAFCNDKWLVITSSGEASVFTPNLNDIPFPPGKSGTTYRTGMATLDTTRSDVLFFPLTVTDLSTATGTNNLAVYDSQSGVGPLSFLKDGTVSYGLPSDAGSGMAVNGQSIFPTYNNNGQYTPQKCEVDSCSNHVGQGGGQPHFHGDPFGDQDPSSSQPHTCLYGPSNYSDGTSGHPPIIGFSNDGHIIYGRYLSSSAPGFQAPLLDACGGHSHDTAAVDEHGFDLTKYHYHTQVFDAVCPSSAMCTAGDLYKVTTTGPFQCFKADLAQSEGSSALLAATVSSAYGDKNSMDYRCCGMTDYYALTGVDVSDSVLTTTTCSAPGSPDNGVYESGSVCATQGAILYSGNQCTPTCANGFSVTGVTRCVKGLLIEIATCVSDSTPTLIAQTPTPTLIAQTSTPSQTLAQTSAPTLIAPAPSPPGPSARLDCKALKPASTARITYDTIMKCLNEGDKSVGLEPGVYLLPGGIRLPAGSSLHGNSASDRSVLRITTHSSRTSFVIATNSNTTISFLYLDGAENLKAGSATSIILVRGSGSVVHDVEAMGTSLGPAVYFSDGSSSNNHVLRVHMHHCHYGVIFAPALDKKHINVVEACRIEHNACDAVTFAGFGKLLSSTVYFNGFACEDRNSSAPGAGTYCHENIQGGEIAGNSIYDNCGMGLDFDTCAHFNVSNNRVYGPGNTVDGMYPHCSGATTFTLLDSQNFHIERNVIANERRSNMQSESEIKDPHNVFSDTSATKPLTEKSFADLPAQANTLLNFVISHRPLKGASPSLGHEIRDNVFIAKCKDPGKKCAGLGYFSGRGTGLHAESIPMYMQVESNGMTSAGLVESARAQWRPSSFSANRVLGSDVGSRRCGKNMYSGDTPSCLNGAPSPCNEDDHEHNKASFRNDPGCNDYTVSVGSVVFDGDAVGRVRFPLPLRPPSRPVSYGAAPQLFREPRDGSAVEGAWEWSDVFIKL